MDNTQNYWGQRDIINTIKTFTKQGSDMINDVISKKYQKYPFNAILKHANILAKVNKSPYGHLHNMTPHDVYSITIHVRKMTLADMSHE